MRKSKPRKNETGNVYGRLTVLEQGPGQHDGKRNRVTWLCRCECGNQATVLGDLLRSGSTRSCGCLAGPINEIGKRYGRLVVLNQAEHDGPFVMWACQCDCGKQLVTRAASLRSGATPSCGCISADRMREHPPCSNGIKLPRRIIAMNAAFNNMKQNAVTRSLAWEIPDDVLEHLCAQDCFYCGREPSNGKSLKDGSYLYSGLDRLDNKIWYRVDNVVPCCRPCNTAKGTMTVPEFLAWAASIRRTLQLKPRREHIHVRVF